MGTSDEVDHLVRTLGPLTPRASERDSQGIELPEPEQWQRFDTILVDHRGIRNIGTIPNIGYYPPELFPPMELDLPRKR